jgi:hypothetical protein
MVPQDFVDALLWVALWSTLAGACGGVLVASLVRWVGEYVHELGERQMRIARARLRDHRTVPAIK